MKIVSLQQDKAIPRTSKSGAETKFPDSALASAVSGTTGAMYTSIIRKAFCTAAQCVSIL